MGLGVKKNRLQGFVNNKGPDLPAHTRNMISAFVIFNDKRHNLGVFCMHVQKEYGKVLEMRSTPILNILAI